LLNIVLADCDLELIPDKLAGHPSVRSYSKKRGKQAKKIILDDNYVHSAIRANYPHTDEELRRGRPDIVHFNMVYILDSIPNKEDKIRLYVHTRNNEVITIDPQLRIPRSFSRFAGVIEKLLFEGIIKSEDGTVLLKLDEVEDLQTFLGGLDVDTVVGLSPTGKTSDLAPLLGGNTAIVLGGFSKGDFLSNFKPDKWIKIYDEVLTTWAVVAEVLKYV